MIIKQTQNLSFESVFSNLDQLDFSCSVCKKETGARPIWIGPLSKLQNMGRSHGIVFLCFQCMESRKWVCTSNQGHSRDSDSKKILVRVDPIVTYRYHTALCDQEVCAHEALKEWNNFFASYSLYDFLEINGKHSE